MEDQSFICPGCGHDFKHYSVLERHTKGLGSCIKTGLTEEQMNDPNRCTYCNQISTTKSNLTKHLTRCKVKKFQDQKNQEQTNNGTKSTKKHSKKQKAMRPDENTKNTDITIEQNIYINIINEADVDKSYFDFTKDTTGYFKILEGREFIDCFAEVRKYNSYMAFIMDGLYLIGGGYLTKRLILLVNTKTKYPLMFDGAHYMRFINKSEEILPGYVRIMNARMSDEDYERIMKKYNNSNNTN